MDESVLAAMDKWPNVPSVSGWLSLDERGHWRLRDEPITHPGLVEFINRNYAADDAGRWYFQNGPQRVYVTLAYTPLVLHVDGGGRLCTHTGQPVSTVTTACVDEEGNLLLETGHGVGLVESGSLPRAAEWLTDDRGAPLSDEALDGLLSGDAAAGARLSWSGRRIPITRIARSEVPERFRFEPSPEPPAAS